VQLQLHLGTPVARNRVPGRGHLQRVPAATTDTRKGRLVGMNGHLDGGNDLPSDVMIDRHTGNVLGDPSVTWTSRICVI
jgi:hypothetical protein